MTKLTKKNRDYNGILTADRLLGVYDDPRPHILYFFVGADGDVLYKTDGYNLFRMRLTDKFPSYAIISVFKKSGSITMNVEPPCEAYDIPRVVSMATGVLSIDECSKRFTINKDFDKPDLLQVLCEIIANNNITIDFIKLYDMIYSLRHNITEFYVSTCDNGVLISSDYFDYYTSTYGKKGNIK